jgi:hypothetical protein
VEKYPVITSSCTSLRPFSISVVSTFFLQAFLPFREGCLCCAGAATEVAILKGSSILLAANEGCLVLKICGIEF